MLPRIAAALLSIGFLSAPALATDVPTPPPAQGEVASVAAMPMPVRELPPTQAEVIQALKARRAKNLKAFVAYRKGGVYPHNTWRRGPLNVWQDANGHLCAAATMIDKDGKHDLVTETAATNNQIRLLDVTDGALMDWILTSGFTIEEIDRIQAPMIEPDEPLPVVDFRVEDAKLAAGYLKTEKALRKTEKSSLALAAKRVMESPHLARLLVDGAV